MAQKIKDVLILIFAIILLVIFLYHYPKLYNHFNPPVPEIQFADEKEIVRESESQTIDGGKSFNTLADGTTYQVQSGAGGAGGSAGSTIYIQTPSGHGAQVNLPYRFQRGQVVDADQVNANFDAIARLYVNVGDHSYAVIDEDGDYIATKQYVDSVDEALNRKGY